MPDPKSNIVFTPVADPIYIHPLSAPITYGSSSLDEIPIRKPSSRDLLYTGSPVIADPTSGKEAQLDYAVVFKLASSLSGLPEKILVDQVDPADMVDLGWKIGSFFIPGWQGLLPAMKKSREASSEQPGQPAV